VFTAHSSPVPVLGEKHLADGAIVCDVSFFGSGAESGVTTSRDDVHYVRGGVLSVVNQGILPRGVSASLGAGELLAGVAEVATLALSGSNGSTGDGPITGEQVHAIVELAAQHGFQTIST
jgi:predicted amino acid dehydrogenase